MAATRSDKRKLRKDEKRNSLLAKSKRQFSQSSKSAGKSIPVGIATGNIPKKIPILALTLHNRPFRWTRDFADLTGSWSWKTPRMWPSDIWTGHIKPLLVAYQEKTWGQIYKEHAGPKHSRKYASYPLKLIKYEARKRLRELGHDVEDISRFRLDTDKRLYGLQFEHRFRVLWWDPDHKIWDGSKGDN